MLDVKLTTLLMVAQEKNFTKASLKLSFTQPAVSLQISALEKEYGVIIFNREKKELTLTPKGEIILNYAKRLKAMEEKLKLELKNFDSMITCLKIGITHTAESNNIIDIISKFSYINSDKKIPITIITDSTLSLYKMVENNELDFAWVTGVFSEFSNTLALPLDDDELVCVLNISHPLAKNAEITLSEIKQERLILRLKNSTTRDLFDKFLESINDSISNYNVVLEVDNIQTIKDLVRKDFGISILSKSACMDELKKGKIVTLPIKEANIKKQDYLIYNKYFEHMEIVFELIDLYKKENQI